MRFDVGKYIIFEQKVEGVLVEDSWKDWNFKKKQNLKQPCEEWKREKTRTTKAFLGSVAIWFQLETTELQQHQSAKFSFFSVSANLSCLDRINRRMTRPQEVDDIGRRADKVMNSGIYAGQKKKEIIRSLQGGGGVGKELSLENRKVR